MTNFLGFAAINYIDCKNEYVERFEELFASRAGAIDKLPGFRYMNVLKPNSENDKYLIVSYWDDEDSFKAWTKSEAFIEGHKRGFADLKKYKEQGLEPPMKSEFKTYQILTD
ncbi:MAG: antibiotic biosynthesis monooxygenase [Calditrichaeota bacterium]|nr:antibiotic biosynthesis monooxygenase [Calditrichota bacterium]